MPTTLPSSTIGTRLMAFFSTGRRWSKAACRAPR
jgi:hypothetical protein